MAVKRARVLKEIFVQFEKMIIAPVEINITASYQGAMFLLDDIIKYLPDPICAAWRQDSNT